MSYFKNNLVDVDDCLIIVMCRPPDDSALHRAAVFGANDCDWPTHDDKRRMRVQLQLNTIQTIQTGRQPDKVNASYTHVLTKHNCVSVQMFLRRTDLPLHAQETAETFC